MEDIEDAYSILPSLKPTQAASSASVTSLISIDEGIFVGANLKRDEIYSIRLKLT